MEMMTENYCDQCDEVLHAIVDVDDFREFKAGPVVCSSCGHVVMPCNECEAELDGEKNCHECPFRDVPPADPIPDEEFVEWHKRNYPDAFSAMLAGEMGEHYEKIAKNLRRFA